MIFISNGAGAGAMGVEALTRMDAWLAAIHADQAPGTAAEKVIRNRPTDLTDACWTSPTTQIDEIFGYQLAGTCETLYPDVRRHAHSPPGRAGRTTRSSAS